MEKICEKEMTDQDSPKNLIESIDSPDDLRKMSPEQLPEVCSEIRKYLLDTLSVNPGHFASSMGAVEITVALHYVFSTPYDRIVWDVGHQAYAHKILTGRRDRFATDLRKLNGLSGFPNPSESEYDTFIAGHASNSISAALGYAIADSNTPGENKRHTVAVIGDASISGGLAFEGLNNASNCKNNLLIILNDNDMSIDDNVGALHRYLSGLTTSKGYNRWRHNTYQKLKKWGLVSENGRGRLLRFNNSVKALVAGKQNIFEGLNIRYFGPFDGHDVGKIVKVLNEIKDMEGPRILHLKTRKGKGFTVAENNPQVWHAPGKFDPSTGERQKKKPGAPLWQEVMGETLVELAGKDDRIMGITAAMPSGTSMSKMIEAYPDRTFDVGISEGHAVTFAGGLAAAGKKPFVAIYSSFLQRAYDNIIHDVAIQGLPVVFCIDRAGIVGEDGVTHHGMFDLAYLRVVPGMTIGSPTTESDLRNMMLAASKATGPMALRYPRGKGNTVDWKTPLEQIPVGKGRTAIDSPDAEIGIISIGPAGLDAQKAVQELSEGKDAPVAALYDMLWLKPIDDDLVERALKRHKHIITVEDGTVTGGLGSLMADKIVAGGYGNTLDKLGVPDNWVHQGSVDQLKSICGYDKEGIAKTINRWLSQES